MSNIRQRVEDRTKVLIRARLRGAGPERDSCILDVSSRGMLLTMVDPPGFGHVVEVMANGHAVVGHVEWAAARRFGVAFRDRINHGALISGEAGPIVLGRAVAQVAARHRPAAARLGSANASAAVRFGLMIAAGVTAAVLLADVVGEALHGALRPASAVMEGGRD